MFLPPFKLYFWPLICGVWGILTFVISYLVAVIYDHVYPIFPYISDTGTRPPESCIFAQMLNMESALLFVTMYIRYRQVDVAMTQSAREISIKSMNVCSVPLGIFACLGISMVGNFQEKYAFVTHMVGAFFTFGIGITYIVVQVGITLAFRRLPPPSPFAIGKCLICLRTLAGLSLIPLFFITSACGYISAQQFTGEAVEYWTENDGAYVLHLVATISEWIAAILMMLFVMSFAPEFTTVRCNRLHFEPVV